MSATIQQPQSAKTSSARPAKREYFNLNIKGLEYLSNIRQVNAQSGTLVSCVIHALAAIFSSLFRSRMHSVGAALHQTIPAEESWRRTVEACKQHPVISLIFIANSSVFQRER